MNYYKALEIADATGEGTGKWVMTMTNKRINGGSPVAIGYCRDNRDTDNPCNHTTEIEACDCYRKYCKEMQGGKMAGFDSIDGQEGTPINIASSY